MKWDGLTPAVSFTQNNTHEDDGMCSNSKTTLTETPGQPFSENNNIKDLFRQNMKVIKVSVKPPQ